MKRKLCPFDKLECVGESCTLFAEKNEICGLVLLCSHGTLPAPGESPKPTRDMERGNRERKSRFKAELFD